MRRSLTASEVTLLHNTFKQDRYIRQRAVRYMRRYTPGWGNRGFRRLINRLFPIASLSIFFYNSSNLFEIVNTPGKLITGPERLYVGRERIQF